MTPKPKHIGSDVKPKTKKSSKEDTRLRRQWRPRHGDLVYYINSFGTVYPFFWLDDFHPKKEDNFLGVYRTEKEAEAVAKAVRKFVKQLNKEK